MAHSHDNHHHQQHGHGGHGHGHNNYGEELSDLVPKLISSFRWGDKHENVLDYGCGDGSTGYKYFLPEVLKYDSKLYSVDLNEKRIEKAQKEYGHPHITYGVGNVLENFPFEDVKFDKIFAIYVCHVVPHMKKTLVRLCSLLKPGGQLAFSVHKNFIFGAVHALAELDKWKKYAEGHDTLSAKIASSDITVESFQKMMEEAGFKVLWTDSKDMDPYDEEMEKFLSKWLSYDSYKFSLF